MKDAASIWSFSALTPKFSILFTILVFALSFELSRRIRFMRFVHPAIITIAAIIVLLKLTGTPYQNYFAGAQFIHLLLGPATVVLAVPLFDNLDRIRAMLVPLLSSCIFGVVMAIIFTMVTACVTGSPRAVSISLAPKSVTTPIAMQIASKLNGISSLTAAMVLITGVVGCLTAPLVFKALGIHDHTIKGFTLGMTAHGFGTAHSFATISALAGAFSGLAMGIAGLATAAIAPLLVPLLS